MSEIEKNYRGKEVIQREEGISFFQSAPVFFPSQQIYISISIDSNTHPT